MVNTIKFSEFDNGGDLSNDKITVGLGTGGNTKYNNPWTFLPPGTTADRPAPSATIQFRLRFNTDLNFYEYYDTDAGSWVELSGSGTGTVNPGLANDLAYYPLNGTAISPVPSQANSLLVTDGSSIPSLSTTLPTGITIPGATITGSTADLTFGSVANLPIAGIDLANKNYVDTVLSGLVTSAEGTANQVLVNGTSGVPQGGALIFTLPQDIAPTSTPQFAGLVLSGTIYGSNSLPILTFTSLAGAVNWLEINNQVTGQNPGFIAFGGDPNVGVGFVTKGTGIYTFASESTGTTIQWQTGTSYQHGTNFVFPNTAATRTVTFPDSNMTVAGTSLLLGGTNNALTASNGGIVWSDATKLNILSGTATPQQLLLSGASGTPQWSTTTYPLTNAINTLLYASSANIMAALATANSSVLITSATGVPSMSGAMTNGQLIIGNTGASPTAATLTAGTGISISNGAGSITITSVGGGTATVSIAGTSQAAAVNTRYIVANAAQTTITLPTTFSIGDTVIIKGLGAGGWILQAGTATTIRFGSATTSSAGTLTSGNQYDTVSVSGLVANTTWSVDYALSGGLTVA